MRSSESSARRTQAASQPTEAVPELTPELVLAVLREFALAYENTNMLCKQVAENIDAEGCAIVAAQLARRLTHRPTAEVLAFFREQARVLLPKARRHRGCVLTVAQVRGIGHAFESGHIDVLDEDQREPAFQRLNEYASIYSLEVKLETMVATLAGELMWSDASPGDTVLEASTEECARDFAIALNMDAPKFLAALRAFVDGKSDASSKYSTDVAPKPANTNARARARS